MRESNPAIYNKIIIGSVFFYEQFVGSELTNVCKLKFRKGVPLARVGKLLSRLLSERLNQFAKRTLRWTTHELILQGRPFVKHLICLILVTSWHFFISVQPISLVKCRDKTESCILKKLKVD